MDYHSNSFHLPVIPNVMWLTSLIFFSLSRPCVASSSVAQDIFDLLNQQAFNEAFVVAQQAQNEYEGDTEFDLAFGLAASASQHCNLGIYALERVVQVQPFLLTARFSLASCYFQLGNLAAADVEIRHLQNMTLSSAIQQNVDQMRYAISRRVDSEKNAWHNAIQVALGQDSNPNNGLGNALIIVPVLGPVTLFEESLATSSTYYQLNGQFTYLAPLDQNSSWFSSLGLGYTDYAESLVQSKTHLNAVLGYTKKIDEKQIGARFFYRPLWLNSQGFLDYYGLIFNASQALQAQRNIGLELIVAGLNYSQLNELDRTQLATNLWFEVPTFSGMSRLTLKVGTEQSTSDAFDFNTRNLWGASYQFTQQFNQKWHYSVSFDYLRAQFDSSHPLFAQTRQDTFLQFVFDLQYQWQTDWLLTAQISAVDNRSNLALYDYKRSNLWFGARYLF